MKNQQSNIVAIDINAVKSRMLQVRGRDVAALYGVETKAVNQAVKRNAERFYDGYILTMTQEECSRSQFVTMSGKRGSNIKYLPHAFTEKGLYMLATVLRSSRAIQETHAIIETYAEVRAMKRELLALHTETDVQKRKSMMRHFGEALTDIVMPDLTTAETESSMEINFLIGKLKHTVRRTRKANEAATGKDVQVRLLEARIRELSSELSNLRANASFAANRSVTHERKTLMADCCGAAISLSDFDVGFALLDATPREVHHEQDYIRSCSRNHSCRRDGSRR